MIKLRHFFPVKETATLERINVQFKASAVDDGARTFEGLASVWGLDLGDDVMHKGAFKETIAEWKKSDDAIPLLNSHDHFDVTSAVGQIVDAKETADGLWIKAEVIDGPDGDAILARLRPSQRTGRAAVSKMSIGYEPAKFDMEESDKARFGIVRNLRKVNLKEVSLVLFPMAPGARINVGSVKALDLESVKSLLASATATEPAAVDEPMRLEMRRLASRIGILLAPIKATQPEIPPAVPTPAQPTLPATPSVPPPTPPVPPSTPVVPPPTPTVPPVTPPTPPAPAQAGEPEGKTALEESAYLYTEALQQRLMRIRNHSLIHNTGAVQ